MGDPDELVCCWCDAERIQGERDDAGRPLTDEEREQGFLAAHEECQQKLDALFADLATKGVRVEIQEGGHGESR